MCMIIGCKRFNSLQQVLKDVRSSGESVIVVNLNYGSPEQLELDVAAAGAVIADFDGTLNVRSQWDRLLAKLPSDVAERNQEDFLAVHQRNDATFYEEAAQLFRSVRDLHEAGLTRADVWQWAREIELREGSEELLRSFPDGRREVISWGVWDLIDRALNTVHGIPVHVNALKLKWAAAGYLAELGAEYERRTAVTDANKGIVRDEAAATWPDLPISRIMVLADGPTDRAMMHPSYLTVCLIPPGDPSAHRQQRREESLMDLFNRSRALLISDSWQPLVDLRTAST